MIRYIVRTPHGVYFGRWENDDQLEELSSITSIYNRDGVRSLTIFDENDNVGAIIPIEVLKQSIIEIQHDES